MWSQVVHYPAPEHRTAALSHQAAGLYLALYFVPQVLHRDSSLMRTLVDRCHLLHLMWNQARQSLSLFGTIEGLPASFLEAHRLTADYF